MKNIPETIYLQLGDTKKDDRDFNDLYSEVRSYTKERIFQDDIEYVRKKPNNKITKIVEPRT